MLRDLLTFAALAVLLLCACSGGGSSDAPAAPTPVPQPPSIPYPVAQAAASGVQRFGDIKAATAAVLAIDRGYAPGQLVGGMQEGRLREDGVILTPQGADEPPAAPRARRFALAGLDAPGTGLRARLSLADDVDAFVALIRVFKDPDNRAAARALLVLGLSSAGYSPDEVFLHLASATHVRLIDGRTFVLDQAGKPLCPAAFDCTPYILKWEKDNEAEESFDRILEPLSDVPSEQPPAPAQPVPAETTQRCATGELAFSAAGLQVLENQYRICREGDAPALQGSGHILLTASDEDCEGTFDVRLTIDARLGEGIVAGRGEQVTTTRLEGDCERERAIGLGGEFRATLVVEGSLTGQHLSLTLYNEMEDSEDVVLIEGDLR